MISPPHLPPELLDRVIDFLCDSSDALISCCLVSKSLIPRTRKHLFAEVEFQTTYDLESWKAFSDPTTSPASYAKTLVIRCPGVIAAAGISREGDCWVSAFSHVTHLTIYTLKRGSGQIPTSLIPFHGFSPALRSLRVTSSAFAPSQIFNPICSFPLLEDLSVNTPYYGPIEDGDYLFESQSTIIQPSSSPAFTGSMELYASVWIGPFVSRLLSLPKGLYSRNPDLTWDRGVDISPSMKLIEGCCSTIESLKIDVGQFDLPQAAHVNLDKAKKLKHVAFICWLRPGWIITTLRTITHDHGELERITLMISSPRGLYGHEDAKYAVKEGVYQEWLELDHLLAQLCESHSIRVKVLYNLRVPVDGGEQKSRINVLLPEIMTRGMVDLVGEYRH